MERASRWPEKDAVDKIIRRTNFLKGLSVGFFPFGNNVLNRAHSLNFVDSMAQFDEKDLLERAKTAFALDVKGWDVLFEDLGFKAWRQVMEVPFFFFALFRIPLKKKTRRQIQYFIRRSNSMIWSYEQHLRLKSPPSPLSTGEYFDNIYIFLFNIFMILIFLFYHFRSFRKFGSCRRISRNCLPSFSFSILFPLSSNLNSNVCILILYNLGNKYQSIFGDRNVESLGVGVLRFLQRPRVLERMGRKRRKSAFFISKSYLFPL